MFKIDQFAAANEAAIAQLTQFAQLSLSNAERFAQLGLAATRETVEQVSDHVQSLAAAKDVHEVIAINSAAVEPAMKRAYSYSRTAYDTAAEVNAQVKKVIDRQAAELNRGAVVAMEEAFKYAPSGSEGMVENWKTAVAAAQSAYGNLAAFNKRMYDSVEKSVEGVAQTAATASVKTARTAKAKTAKAKRSTRSGKRA
jgi:phasin family protein